MVIRLNNKDVKIPDNEIKKLMKVLELTKQEAINTWLNDNDYTTNEQIEELTRKAKENKTDKVVAVDRTKPRKKVDREPKANPDKEFIIDKIYYLLCEVEHTEQVKITNKTKIIEFTYHGKQFKLDLIEKRKK